MADLTPVTREEQFLDKIAEALETGGGGGGGGGTTNYNHLSNKPQINGNTLSGNKTAAELGFATVSTTGAYSDLSGKPALANVATSGSYLDLTNTPSIPAAQVNSDWNAASGVAQILNKPTLGTAAASATTDFATAAQGTKADSAIQGVKVGSTTLTPDSGKAVTISKNDITALGIPAQDTTYVFEGTYNASTNKAVTMADIKDGKLTGYAQSSGNVAATDKVIEAIGKVEKKADDNTTNILTVEDSGGVKNLLPITRDSIKANNPSLSWTGYTINNHGGLTFTFNEDLSVTINGTASNTAPEIILCPRAGGTGFLKNGTYTFDGGYSTPTELLIGVNRTVGSSGQRYAAYEGTPVTFTVSDSPNEIGVWIGVNATGKTVTFDNVVVKPMICSSAMWGISHTYQTPTITLAELYQKLKEANVI